MTLKELDDQSAPGGPPPDSEGNAYEGNATVPISVPGTIPGN